MADFVITEEEGRLFFEPDAIITGVDQEITTENGTGGSVPLYVYFSPTGAPPWRSDTTLFGFSETNVQEGNQVVGTVQSTASLTGEYLLDPSSSPPSAEATEGVLAGGKGNNVRVNVGSSLRAA